MTAGDSRGMAASESDGMTARGNGDNAGGSGTAGERDSARNGGSTWNESRGTSGGESDMPTVTGRRRWHARQIAVAVLAIAAITTGIVLGRHTLAESLHKMAGLDWTWFLLAIACECISLAAFGLSRRRLLRADGAEARFGAVMAITYASNALSMTIPFAGAQLAVIFSYRQFRRRGLGQAITGWALAVSAILSMSALAVVLVVGSIANGASIATAIGFAGAAVLILPAVAILLALRNQRLRRVLSVALNRVMTVGRRLMRRPPGQAADALEEILDRVASIRMPWPRYAEVFGLALLNWIGDCACLACAIHAAGQPVPWGGLLLAYAAGAAAGSTGLTPGGFGLVEATLTAALVAAGMNTSAALTSVLAYRLVNFWMILIGGWAAMVVLTRFRSHTATSPDIPAAQE
jgi:putative heme transporter